MFDTRKRSGQKGFGVAELLIVLLVIAIVVVLALPQIIASRRLFRFSGLQRQVVSLLRETRQQAMSQRNPITLRYDDTNKRIIIYGGSYGGLGGGNNQVVEMATGGITPGEVIYGRPASASVGALGDGSNLTALASNAVEIQFQADGSVIDSNNNPQNKSLFFYDSKNPAETAFAISVLGAGGRAKIWRYNSGANIYVE